MKRKTRYVTFTSAINLSRDNIIHYGMAFRGKEVLVKMDCIRIGRRFSVRYPETDRQLKLVSSQEELIRELARHDCIIVGRAADVLLSDMHPFNSFSAQKEKS